MHQAETLSHASPRLPEEGKNPADKLCSQQHREQQTSIEKETKQKQMALIGDHLKNNAWQQLKKTQKASSCMSDVSCWPLKHAQNKQKATITMYSLKKQQCMCVFVQCALSHSAGNRRWSWIIWRDKDRPPADLPQCTSQPGVINKQ